MQSRPGRHLAVAFASLLILAAIGAYLMRGRLTYRQRRQAGAPASHIIPKTIGVDAAHE